MIEIVAVSGAAFIAWYILYFLIPWMAKRATVYGLHGLRDRMHVLLLKLPALRESELYRDMDYLLAQDVRYAREVAYTDFAKRLVSRLGRAPETRHDLPYEKDITELNQTASGREAQQELFSIFDAVTSWNLIRLLFGHPFVLALSVPAVLITFFVATYRTLMPSVPDQAKLATAVRQEAFQDRRGSGLRIAA